MRFIAKKPFGACCDYLSRPGTICRIFLIGTAFTLAACAYTKPAQIDLMPAPDVYDEGAIDPFADSSFVETGPGFGLFYATDRAPVGEKDQERFYLNARGHLLRLGVAQVELSTKAINWEEARRISLLKNRTDKYPLKVGGIQEFGVLADSYTVFDEPDQKSSLSNRPGRHFAARIDKKLARSRQKEIFIYVHGYKVVFENPLLVTAELWHFLGYEGVFIAYAWPSTPSTLAYFSDLETAAYSARNLRVLIQYLARETRAEKINIIGYSAGTRVVVDTLYQLALLNSHKTRAEIQKALRLGNVILVGSDLDRDLFGSFLDDGLLNVPTRMTVYMSETDQALGISKFVFGRKRLGQTVGSALFQDPGVVRFLRANNNLILIDVTKAEQAAAGNGHAYFRQSPWVSSDVLTTLRYNLLPAERGLRLDANRPVWNFPADYIERLRAALVKTNPDLSKGLRKGYNPR